MGAYLCIASNGVPPSVSKRIKVSVDCKYFKDYLLRVFFQDVDNVINVDNKLNYWKK